MKKTVAPIKENEENEENKASGTKRTVLLWRRAGKFVTMRKSAVGDAENRKTLTNKTAAPVRMIRGKKILRKSASSLAFAFAFASVLGVAGCRNVPFYRMTSKASKSLPLSREGIVAFERGDLLRAEENLREAVALNDSDVETCLYYAETLWKLGKRGEAVEALEAAATKRATIDVEVALYRSLGEKALETNRPEDAVRWANKIVDLTPKSAVGWELRGKASRRLDRPTEALEDFQRAAHFAVDDRALLREIATIQNEVGDFDAGLATWQHLERLYPVNREPAEIFAGQGEAYCGLGLAFEAEEAFAVASASAPDVVEYRLRLAETRLARGKIDGAFAALNEAALRDPNDPLILNLRARALQMRQTASVSETIAR